MDLAYFEAEAGKKSITVTWATATEIDNAGFLLLRGEAPAGPFDQLTPTLIPGKGSSISGATYTYEDRHVRHKRLYYYVLVDVDLYGNETQHGPVSASIGTPKSGRHGNQGD